MIALRIAAFFASATFVLTASACGDDDEISPSETAAPSVSTTGGTKTASATASPTASPTLEPFAGGREPVEATPVPGGPMTALLRAVSIAEQGAFDRITFEFEGGLPGYGIRYIDPPIIADPSGLVVDMDGSAFIQIRMEPAAGHDPDTGIETYTGPLELKPA